jgi:DNA-binding response OmpR family regulator
MDDYVSKPFEAQQLYACIDRMLGQQCLAPLL